LTFKTLSGGRYGKGHVRREGGKEGRREGGKEGRREGGKEGRREGTVHPGHKINTDGSH